MISVIVPVYNVEKHLDKCIQSIVDQTYKNLEIIIVDDGSVDNCPAICDDWAKKDSRIIVIHKKNGGLSSARNAALDIMQGDYVIFVDSDDWIEPDMAQSMLSYALENNADIVCSGFFFENIDCTHTKQIVSENVFENKDIAENLLLDNIRPEVCSKLYKADLIKQFRFDEKIKYAEDLPFNFYLMQKANKLITTETWFYHYLLNSGNSITTPYITDARATSWKIFDGVFETVLGNKILEDAAVFRFTIYTFAVLSRVLTVKEYRKKYFNEISRALLKHKKEILENNFVPKKHKTALKILSVNKNLYLIFYNILSIAMKMIK